MDTRTILVFVVVMATIMQGTVGWFNHGGGMQNMGVMQKIGGLQNQLGDHLQKWKKMAEEKKKNYPPSPWHNVNGGDDSASDDAPGKDNKDKNDDDDSDDKHKKYNVNSRDQDEHEKDSSKGRDSKDSEKGSESKDSDKGGHSKDNGKESVSKDSDKNSKSKDSKKGSKDDDKDSESKDSKKGSKDNDKDSKSKDSKNKSKDSDKDSKSKDSKNKSKDDDKNSKSKDSEKGSKDDDKDSKSKDSKNKSKDDDKDSKSKDSKNKSKDDDKDSKNKDSKNKSKDSDKDSKSKDSKNKSKDDDKDSKSKDSKNKSKDSDKDSKSKNSKKGSKDDDKDSKSKGSKSKSKDSDKDSKSKDSKKGSKDSDKSSKSDRSSKESKSKDSTNGKVEDDCDGQRMYATCESWNFEYDTCEFDLGNATIKGVRVNKQLSKTDCQQDVNWGFTSAAVWVDAGCRAKFELCLEVEDDCDGQRMYATCESWNFEYDTCEFDLGNAAIKGVRVNKQLSKTDCQQDVNWGFTSAAVWVDAGCRAKFELCLGVDGGWSTWSEYGSCSKSCGGGTKSRSRTCSSPSPSNSGADCIGNSVEQISCNTQPCPVDGGWSSWSAYGSCSKTCGTGSQSRSRTCSNPAPSNGGLDCVGDAEEQKSCNTQTCPVDGGWSSWSAYGSCSKTCGTGSQSRSRTCSNPAPSNGGLDCVGDAEEQKSCNTQPCPVDGGWTPWSEYGSCSKTCGTGSQSRSRSCTNPEPANNGADCIGDTTEERVCNAQECPVDGEWSSWSEYSTCSKTCATGSQTRTRSCSNPPPSNNGEDCVGEASEARGCNTDPCPFEEACDGQRMDATCESWNFEYDTCEFDLGHVTIKGVRVNKQLSKTNCQQDVNWGFTSAAVWVDAGCRAEFELCLGVDGGWSTWSEYESCTKSCGGGKQSRSRTCSDPSPSSNGADCIGNSVEQICCNKQPCPVDGGWSSSSRYCPRVIQSRSRTCSNPPPSNKGVDCVGNSVEQISCNTRPCPIDGGWTSWSAYGSCSKTCGTGSQSRSRTCSNPAPLNGGLDCVGDTEEQKSCNTQPCPVDGGWTSWSEYGSCTKTCGTGSQSRSRSCTNPEPANNGADCMGDLTEERVCNIQECPVDGGWTSWSAYGSCSKTCGTGSQSRSRTCSNPAPSNGGLDCVGDTEEQKSCNTQPCPVDGGWTTWSEYGSCSKTCGAGSQSRSRSCTNPEPANNGADCIGDTIEERVCNVQECPVDGEWSSWSEYGVCSKTCATGSQIRSRTCSNPPPSNNGEDCVGEASEAQSCNTDPCPFEEACDGQRMDATCESWNFEYDTCEFDLGNAAIKGVRVNKQLSKTDCQQDVNWGFTSAAVWVDAGCRAEFELCLGVDGGWSTWSEYGSCTKSCGRGKQSRSRTCSNPSPSSNGADCIGNSVEQICCNKQPCPVDGGWTSWSAYGSCSKTCGTGSQSRSRTCSNPAPSNGGLDCVGDTEEQKSCNTQPCPVDGGWTSWSEYGSCSKTCGTGSQSRSRSCTNPEPANNGADCIGDIIEERVCNVQECPVDGGWSSWSEYGTCSKTCATGSQTRTRSCSNPPPSNNGEDCVGEASEAQSCNTDPCPFEEACDGQRMDATCESWNFEYDTCEFDLGPATIKGVRVDKQLSKTDCQQDVSWGFTSAAVWVDAGCRAEFELCLGVDGGWSTWSEYGSCSKSCGGGTKSRSRTCSNPSPSSNGADCIGNSVEQISCNKETCPVDGGWSSWSEYGSCSKTCGGGTQSRSRTCSNPQPSNNGADCVGNSVEEISCNTRPCPVDGGWSDWSSYSQCSTSCGSGKQSRTRTCSNPPTANGGAECVGKSQEESVCNQTPCPSIEVDGAWSSWSSYGPCSKSCGSGKQARTRTCSNPHPSDGGADCVGKANEMRSCNTFPCPSGPDTMKPPYKKPKECHVDEPCCETGQLKVNLGSRKLKIKTKREGALKGVKVGRFSRGDRNPCSQSVVITADFERIDNNSCFGCLQAPYCGRRMLKIDLELSNAGRSGWLFDVGDSQSNDGSGSDGSHQENNAEVVGKYPNITVFPSDKCSGLDRIMQIVDGSTSAVHTVTLYVSNEHIRVTNSDGLDYHVCSGCLFALNGQSDSGSNGGNERVHVGLNRVLAGMSRVGYGVCSATLTWACPWCD